MSAQGQQGSTFQYLIEGASQDGKPRQLRRQFNIADPSYEAVTQPEEPMEEDHPFFRDKALLTKVSRHLRRIEVNERGSMQINGRNLVIFTLSFITILVFIVYLSSFTNEILVGVHWSVLLVLSLLLVGITVLSYFQQIAQALRTRFILKSSLPHQQYLKFFSTAWFSGYCLLFAFMVLLAWYSITKTVSYWSLLVSLGFQVVNFFVLYTDGSNWYFQVPLFLANMLYVMVVNFEIRLLAEVAEFASVYKDYETQFHLSRPAFLNLGYSANLYSSFYYRMKLLEKNKLHMAAPVKRS